MMAMQDEKRLPLLLGAIFLLSGAHDKSMARPAGEAGQ